MAKSKIKKPDDWCVEDFMTGIYGVSVYVKLWWDGKNYYCWLEDDTRIEDILPWVDSKDSAEKLIKKLDDECKRFGVMQSYYLESINHRLVEFCGDDNPISFYEDDDGNIIVCNRI